MKESMIGVIGTLLGTILGWVLNSLSQKGKISIFVNKWKQSFKYNNSGFIEECPIKDKVEFYSYDLQLGMKDTLSFWMKCLSNTLRIGTVCLYGVITYST